MSTEDRWIAPIIIANLRIIANQQGVRQLASKVLENPKFRIWAGSCGEGAHHGYDGGLAEHTEEVVSLCFHNKRHMQLNDINEQELFLAALFHDVGKMWDYEKVDGKWIGTDHKRNIHHISRSGIEWAIASDGLYPDDARERVLHAILAHHGSRAWGSPVAPKSQIAWLVHICDQLSARMNDWNTSDVISKGDK